MSIYFDGSSYYHHSPAIFDDDLGYAIPYPISISFWAKTNSDAVTYPVYAQADNISLASYYYIAFTPGHKINLTRWGTTTISTVNSYTVGEWVHIAVESNTNSQTVWLNGDDANKGHSGEAQNITNNRSCFGALVRSFLTTPTIGTPLNGNIANFTIWQGYTLTAADVNALAKGKSPFSIKAQNIVRHFPMSGNEPPSSGLIDIVNFQNINEYIVGSPIKDEQAPIVRNYFMAGCG